MLAQPTDPRKRGGLLPALSAQGLSGGSPGIVAKNLFLSREKSVSRKLEELALAEPLDLPRMALTQRTSGE